MNRTQSRMVGVREATAPWVRAFCCQTAAVSQRWLRCVLCSTEMLLRTQHSRRLLLQLHSIHPPSQLFYLSCFVLTAHRPAPAVPCSCCRFPLQPVHNPTPCCDPAAAVAALHADPNNSRPKLQRPHAPAASSTNTEQRCITPVAATVSHTQAAPHLVLQCGSEEEVHDLVLLDRQREEVHLLKALDLALQCAVRGTSMAGEMCIRRPGPRAIPRAIPLRVQQQHQEQQYQECVGQ